MKYDLVLPKKPAQYFHRETFPSHKIWPKHTFKLIHKSNSKLNYKLLVVFSKDLYKPPFLSFLLRLVNNQRKR